MFYCFWILNMVEIVQIVEFVVGLCFQDIFQLVWCKVLDYVIDVIGCGLVGVGSSLLCQFLYVLFEEVGFGLCSVMGMIRLFGLGLVVFVNVMVINVLDFDDGLEEDGKGFGYFGVMIIVVVIFVVFLCLVSGWDFLIVVVVGYEVNVRLICVIQLGIQWFWLVYGVCQYQGIGGVVVFGWLMGLDVVGMVNVLGFVGMFVNVFSLCKYNWDSRFLVLFKDFVVLVVEFVVCVVWLY